MISNPTVRLRHLWEATCEIWPRLPVRVSSRGRANPGSDKRATFALAAKNYGFSQMQIGKFVKRERSSIANAQTVAKKLRRNDPAYAQVIIDIRAHAERLAATEPATTVIMQDVMPYHEPKPRDHAQEFYGRYDKMMERGSRDLLAAIVQHHAYAFRAAA